MYLIGFHLLRYDLVMFRVYGTVAGAGALYLEPEPPTHFTRSRSRPNLYGSALHPWSKLLPDVTSL